LEEDLSKEYAKNDTMQLRDFTKGTSEIKAKSITSDWHADDREMKLGWLWTKSPSALLRIRHKTHAVSHKLECHRTYHISFGNRRHWK
jgi:hypothetical protein